MKKSELQQIIREEITKMLNGDINESMDKDNYKKITDAVNNYKQDINKALVEGSDHRYWKIQVLPNYDNFIGGFNLQATATDAVDRNIVLGKYEIRKTIDSVKKLPFVSKAKVSSAYNTKMLTVISIGLKMKK
jgi:hypothetical protein